MALAACTTPRFSTVGDSGDSATDVGDSDLGTPDASGRDSGSDARADAPDLPDAGDIPPAVYVPNPCANGDCRAIGESFTCDCDDGWDGDLCEENVDDCAGEPCRRGTCVDLIDGFECDCPDGYDGLRCDNNVDECAETPCDNDALCIDGIAEFSCECRYGYEGDHCEIELNSCDIDPCRNGAACSNLPGVGKFECECLPGLPGFYGPICRHACEQGRCVGEVLCDSATGEDRVCTACEALFEGEDCSIDLRTCGDEPCFPTVPCTEVDTSFECAECPESYEGDGLSCRPAVDWFTTYGDPNDDWASGSGSMMDVAADEDGGIYVLGTFGNDMTVGLESFTVGRFGGYLAKFGPDGEHLWATAFGVTDGRAADLSPLKLQIQPGTGDIIVVANGWLGFANIGGTDYGQMHGNTTRVAARLDSETGAVVWATLLDPTVATGGEGLALDPDGNVLLATHATGPIAGVDAFGPAASYVVRLDAHDGRVLGGFGFGDAGPRPSRRGLRCCLTETSWWSETTTPARRRLGRTLSFLGPDKTRSSRGSARSGPFAMRGTSRRTAESS